MRAGLHNIYYPAHIELADRKVSLSVAGGVVGQPTTLREQSRQPIASSLQHGERTQNALARRSHLSLEHLNVMVASRRLRAWVIRHVTQSRKRLAVNGSL